jgi:hypothetical protein
MHMHTLCGYTGVGAIIPEWQGRVGDMWETYAEVARI